MPLTFRPARAGDIAAAIALIHSSGPAAFDYVFCDRGDDQAKQFLRMAFEDGGGRFGWRNHSVACMDERVVGIGAAYGADTNLPYMLADGRLILRYYGHRGLSVVGRGLRAERIMPPPGRDEWMLAHLGIAPELRGAGIGAKLVLYLLDRGARAGRGTAVLDVSVENPRAESLYTRLGFKQVKERASHLRSSYGHVANHRRMELALGAPAP